ncbi:hypothetical protein MmiHf6_13410 [Methanimicrococcus hongohii]|uniref:Uncharacterized protein n=1 Tax=Methanimicrococcus hongohii TaxID=3028295 RepID=A0AA96V9M9_9EURY|nr:hypothetical protein [Methanimicrococcus sp. Hf6]WNY24016.1 hypothetical protein MmiHf6_13410 [Methanimicrococcus sp. Hf6]
MMNDPVMEKITENEIISRVKNRFGNVVAEEPAAYRTKNEKDEKTYCFLLEELTNTEMVAIGNYQDIHPWNDQKQNWSFETPEHWKTKAYCFAINSCCRFPDFYNDLMKEEQELIDFNFQHLDSAIEKGRILGNPFIYRGVYDVDWLPKNHTIGTEYIEDAYGSFSLKLENALQYTNPENPIIFRLEVTENMKVL